MSPDCQDVDYVPGSVRTRPGSVVAYTGIANAPKVNGLATFITLALVQRLVMFSSDGQLISAVPDGAMTVLASSLQSNSWMSASNEFGVCYVGIHNGTRGVHPPMYHDGTNLRRVSPCNPGSAPNGVDSATAGNISAGVHKVTCWFITESGTWTKYAPPSSWTAAGSKKVDLTSLPIGPTGTIARALAFTATAGTRFYHVPSTMYVNDNTTTALTIDFTDAALLSGRNVDFLLNLEQVQAATVPIAYKERMFWIGEVNHIPGFNNMGFEGGIVNPGSPTPTGWTTGATTPGGAVGPATPGNAWYITGDGVTAIRGFIQQSAYQDAWTGTQLFQPNTSYTVAARVRKTAGLLQGRLNIDISDGGSVDTIGLVVNAVDVTTTVEAEYTAELFPAGTAITSNLTLRLFVDGTPTNNEQFIVDEIRIYPTAEPALYSRVRASFAGDPEMFDGTTGTMNVKEDNGQRLTTMFVQGGFLYLVKERSLYVTQDDGYQEPSSWTLEEISPTIGSPSPRGVGLGEGWAAIADRSGLYLFNGGRFTEDKELSREIRPTWNRINWAGAGHTVWVLVNPIKKKVLVGVPLDAATQPSHTLMLDYQEGMGDPMTNDGHGRKWSIWTLAGNSAALVESASGPRTFLGSGVANGKVYEQTSTALDDAGQAINSYYDTYYYGNEKLTRMLFGQVHLNAEGSGTLLLSATRLSGSSTNLVSHTLRSPEPKTIERKMNLTDSRVRFRIRTNALGSWFVLTKFTVFIGPAPWSY